jgi:hypothetical protein
MINLASIERRSRRNAATTDYHGYRYREANPRPTADPEACGAGLPDRRGYTHVIKLSCMKPAGWARSVA